jgi:multiple sugar transport system substrate-binding protein
VAYRLDTSFPAHGGSKLRHGASAPETGTLVNKSVLRWPLLAVIGALALTSCATGTGGQNDDDVVYDPNAKLSGTINVLGFGAGDEIATTRLDEAKKALGKDVKVKLVEGDLDIQQLLSAIAAGDPPELIYANRDQIGSLAARGAIIPLEKCIQGEGINTDQFVDSAVAQVTLDDEIYGIPEFNVVQLTMANTSLLQAAGLGIDSVNGSDWSKVTAAATALSKNSGGELSVIGVDSKMPEFFPLWAKANGVDLISEDGKTANLNDPKAVEALDFAVNVYNEQGGFSKVKAFRDSADFFGSGNQFAANQLGSMFMEQWYVNVLNDVSPDATISFDTFRTPQGDPLAFASGSAWAIPAGSETSAASCRFAKAMTATDSWVAAANARVEARKAEGKPFTGLLTGNEDADEAVRALVTSSGSAQWDSAVDATYLANDNTFSLPANPADAEFKAAWLEAANKVLTGDASAQEALDDAQKTAQDALDKAWAKFED